MAAGTSRIAEARRRATGAKQTAVAVAAAGFLAIALLARHSHPGQASSSSSPATGSTIQSDDDGGFSLTPGSIAPSGGSGSGGGPQTSVS
jgi:hypothetical protein